MAKPLRLIVDFLMYEGTQTNNPEDAIKVKSKVEESDVSEGLRRLESIPDATVDLAITLPDANTDYLLMLVDREISIKLNGSGDAITLKPRANGSKTPVFLLRGDITALTISNSSGAAANIDLVAVNI